jgi:restriction endonuclease S subunit
MWRGFWGVRMPELRQPVWINAEDVPQLPEGWRSLRTAEACIQLKPGKLFDSKTISERGHIPVLNQSETGFLGYHDEEPGVTASPEAPVVTFANHTCAMRLMTQPFSSIQNIFPKVGKPGVTETIYFYYATLGRVALSDYKGHHPVFRQAYIPIPPLPIQRRIADILSAYDKLIENCQRRIQILEQMARALYREWFVKFRYPGHQSVPLVPSPLGEIPQGWSVRRVGDVADVLRGRSYRSADLVETGGLPFLNLKCLDRDGGFRRAGLKRYSGDFKPHHVAKKGDIVMAVTDMTQERRIVARAALVPTLDNDFGILSMDLVRIESKPGVPTAFLYALLRFSSFADEVKQHANGANVLHLAPDRISEYQSPMPGEALMAEFARYVEPLSELSDQLHNKMQVLRSARDLLLPRLISGQIDLDAA